ncbi:peptidoglycan-binding protein [Zobellella denitrificans]|uniref:Peptidoglycan-binding protein n=1 Tax=Zobellella denitrificans TaxID=347534 RepID=A0A231MWN1_9GAMM|nr:peptidoglycan DD-metalloendopeptidase family protein [Zobellella denitrificans]ATG75116.1 peptidoglycan-binding protein [Zobellella denitrificans]OXS14578.1 peptidoglycan-binding protein [Zobellella denitrificans]
MRGRGASIRLLGMVLASLALLTACAAPRPAPVTGVGSRAPAPIGGHSHRVERGDTLYSIAWQAGTDVPTLARHNNIQPPYNIYVGQVLRLDVPGGRRTFYRVKRGDTLNAISRQTGHSVADLATLNNLKPPYRIYVGQQLTLRSEPSASSKPVPAAAASPAPAVRPSTAQNGARPAGTSSPAKTTKPLAPAQGKAYAGSKVQKNAAVNTAIVWQWPAQGPIISGFSLAETGNKGIDIRGSRGQAIKAAAAGKVVYAGSALRGYGNLIIIKHNDDYLSAYAHNEVLRVKEQEAVSAGQHIADMGSSDTTDVRLHFEIRYQGTSVDPMRYLPKR